MHPKAQISTEFFIFVGMAFIVALAFELASLGQINDFRRAGEDASVKDFALKLQKEVFIASYVEDGYLRTFEIPNNLEGINFSVTISNSTYLAVESKNSIYSAPIPFVAGNFSKGANTISKTGGVIYINSKVSSFFTSYSICQNAESLGLCNGLDFLFGAGYECLCDSEHGLCRPCNLN